MFGWYLLTIYILCMGNYPPKYLKNEYFVSNYDMNVDTITLFDHIVLPQRKFKRKSE